MSANIDHDSKAKAIVNSFTTSFPDVPIRYFKKANKIGEFCQISASKNFEFGDIIPIVKIETSTKPNTTVHAKLRVNDDYYNIFNTMIEKNIFDNNTGDFNFVVESFDDSQGYTHINFVLMSKPNVTIVNAFRKINDIMIPQITKMIKHYAEVVIPEQAASYTATNADFPALSTSTNNTTKATTTWSPVIPKDTTPAEPVVTAEQPKDDFPPLVIKQEAAPIAAPVVSDPAPVAEPVAAPVAPVAPVAKGTTTPPPVRAFTPVQSVPATQNAVITPVQSPIVTHASNPQKQLFPRPPLMHQPQYPYPPMGMPMCQPPFMPFNGISKESLDAEQMQIADMEMRIAAMQKELEFMKRAHSLNIAHYNRIVSLRQDSDCNPHAWQEVTIEQ